MNEKQYLKKITECFALVGYLLGVLDGATHYIQDEDTKKRLHGLLEDARLTSDKLIESTFTEIRE